MGSHRNIVQARKTCWSVSVSGIDEMSDMPLVVPTGECIGMVSPALAGGHGLLQGQYGLLADQILSARLILANGTVVTVSETSYPDLFWGLKGAGKNFGIVSELEYKVYDIPAGDNWIMEKITFTNDRLEDVFEWANGLLDIQPAEMVHFVYFTNEPEIDPDMVGPTSCSSSSKLTNIALCAGLGDYERAGIAALRVYCISACYESSTSLEPDAALARYTVISGR